jgi:hypothetical protein
MINMENKHHTKFWDEMDSVNMMARTPSMPMKQTVYHPASMQPTLQDEGIQENLPCSFQVCSRENESYNQQGSGGSGATPKCQGSDR